MIDIGNEVPESDFEDIKERLLHPHFALYCLAAEFDNYKGYEFDDSISSEKQEELLLKLIDDLKCLPLPPTQIHISNLNDRYVVEGLWEFGDRIVLRTPEEYILLLNNFQNYISKSVFFSIGEVRTNLWNDDPTDVNIQTQLFNQILGVRNEIVEGNLNGINAYRRSCGDECTVIDFSDTLDITYNND